MSNLIKVREALFNQLDALNEPSLKEDEGKLKRAIAHAGAIKEVCDTIIDSAKLEHNYMKMRQKNIPLTDFMPISQEDELEKSLTLQVQRAREKQNRSIESFRLKEAQQKRLGGGQHE